MEFYIILALVMVVFSAFFSGMEIAFVTANKLKIELDKQKRKISGRIISNFKSNSAAFISTMLLGNTIALVIYGIAMSHLLTGVLKNILPSYANSDFAVIIMQTIISTLLILFIGEFAPKALFRINPNKILSLLVLPLTLLYYLLYPLQFVFVKLSEFILKYIVGTNIAKSNYKFSQIDLDYYIREYSASTEDFEDYNPEIQMFQNVIGFSSTKVRECMIPRNEITAIEESETIVALKEKFIESGHSKILVYRNHIDNIVGFVHSFDLFNQPRNIKSIKKPVIIVPESMLAKESLKLFINQHRSIAVVVDEFGGTSGIVSLEDLIEEITGEINDEFDEPELHEKVVNNNEYIFSGRLEIDYLNTKYNFQLPVNEEYETLAGFILAHLERIPENKETLVLPPYRFTILKASNNRIDLVQLIISDAE